MTYGTKPQRFLPPPSRHLRESLVNNVKACASTVIAIVETLKPRIYLLNNHWTKVNPSTSRILRQLRRRQIVLWLGDLSV